MSDHISREAAIELLQYNTDERCSAVVADFEAMPAADVEPVRHGEWIQDHDYLKCPECGVMVMRDFTFFDIGDWNYCPNCGAKMDLEVENDG